MNLTLGASFADELSKLATAPRAPRMRKHAWVNLLPLAGRALAGLGGRAALKAGAKTLGSAAAQGGAMQLGSNLASRMSPSATPRRPAPQSPAAAPQPFNSTAI